MGLRIFFFLAPPSAPCLHQPAPSRLASSSLPQKISPKSLFMSSSAIMASFTHPHGRSCFLPRPCGSSRAWGGTPPPPSPLFFHKCNENEKTKILPGPSSFQKKLPSDPPKPNGKKPLVFEGVYTHTNKNL